MEDCGNGVRVDMMGMIDQLESEFGEAMPC